METPPGFNLDQAVGQWRDELARQPGLTPADLREFEAHLRDGFAELRKNPIREEEAFLLACRRVGPTQPIVAELVKVARGRIWAQKIFWLVTVAFMFQIGYQAIDLLEMALGYNGFDDVRGPWGFCCEIILGLVALWVAALWLVRGPPRFFIKLLSSRESVVRMGIGMYLCLLVLIAFTLHLRESWPIWWPRSGIVGSIMAAMDPLMLAGPLYNPGYVFFHYFLPPVFLALMIRLAPRRQYPSGGDIRQKIPLISIIPNQTSFNLDTAVAAWRAELAAHPGPAPADLRELEAHLRDAFAEFTKADLRDDEAFLLARQRVGPSKPVAAEFAKAAPRRFWSWLAFGTTFAVVFGVFAAHAFSAAPEYLESATILSIGRLSPDKIDIHLRHLESREVAQRVADLLSPDERQAFVAPFAPLDPANAQLNLVDRLLEQRMVKSVSWANYISIKVGVEHPNPQLAALVAADFARVFIRTEYYHTRGIANGVRFTFPGEARYQYQSEPKVFLFLTSGFFFGLLAASAAAALVRLAGSIRFRPPPAKLAS